MEGEKQPLDHSLRNQDSEVMSRVLELLEEQRLQRQAVLARSEEELTRQTLQVEALRALLGPEPLTVLDLLVDVGPSVVLALSDSDGRTLLHHAARIGAWQVTERLVSINPHVCDQFTSPSGRPAHWSPLMVFIDSGCPGLSESQYMGLLHLLLNNSSLATVEARAANGMSALHMSCSKGMNRTTRKVVWAIYNKATGNEAAFGLVSSLLNQPDARGRGCVPWTT